MHNSLTNFQIRIAVIGRGLQVDQLILLPFDPFFTEFEAPLFPLQG